MEHLGPNEEIKIKAYLRGLPAQMKLVVRISGATTVHKAIEESLRMEDDMSQALNERWQTG